MPSCLPHSFHLSTGTSWPLLHWDRTLTWATAASSLMALENVQILSLVILLVSVVCWRCLVPEQCVLSQTCVTTYFLLEVRPFLPHCLKVSFVTLILELMLRKSLSEYGIWVREISAKLKNNFLVWKKEFIFGMQEVFFKIEQVCTSCCFNCCFV